MNPSHYQMAKDFCSESTSLSLNDHQSSRTLSAAETIIRLRLYKFVAIVMLTIKSNVVWLYKSLLHLAVLNNEGISLASISAEDGCTIKGQVKAFRKC